MIIAIYRVEREGRKEGIRRFVFYKLDMQPGLLHQYARGLVAFEFGVQAPNVLLFVGGLTNGLLDVPYLKGLARSVSETSGEQWSLVQVLLTSSYSGWGTLSLQRDAQELGLAVEYLRSEQGGLRQKIVLMGHSTGCQDAMQYLTRYKPRSSSQEIHGAILQAPVSDSEGVSQNIDPVVLEQMLNEVETEYIRAGKEKHILPQRFSDVFWGSPISAYRFYSLLKPKQDDDFFSSYLTDTDLQLSFGQVHKPLLVLYGSKDEFVPEHVHKQELINGWKAATSTQFWSPLSKILQGATHDVGSKSEPGAEDDLIKTIVQFLQQI